MLRLKILKILFLILSLVFALIATVHSEEISSPEIDMENGCIIVTGVGTIPAGISKEKQLNMARLAAKVDAQRNLLELIANLRLDDEVSMVKDFREEATKIQIDGIIKDAEIIPESEVFKEGIYVLKMKIQVKKLTPLIYPPTDSTFTDIQSPYTGLIIDAQKLNVQFKESWEIRDSRGKLIYSSTRAIYYPKNTIFKTSRDDALKETRIGDNPLIITALDTYEHIIIISVQDGQFILSALQDTDIFLLSKIAVIIGGSK